MTAGGSQGVYLKPRARGRCRQQNIDGLSGILSKVCVIFASAAFLVDRLPVMAGETSFCSKFVRPQGYSCVEHQMTTSDGYILHIQNIAPNRGSSSPPEPPPSAYGVLNAPPRAVGDDPLVDAFFAPGAFDYLVETERTSAPVAAPAGEAEAGLGAVAAPEASAAPSEEPPLPSSNAPPPSASASPDEPSSPGERSRDDGSSRDDAPESSHHHRDRNEHRSRHPQQPPADASASRASQSVESPATDHLSPPSSPAQAYGDQQDPSPLLTPPPNPGPGSAPPGRRGPLYPVYFDHALFLGGEVWFDALPANTRLPFILVDLGFDVWVGHHRGTEYSPEHTTLTRTQFAFWDFSFDELAAGELPAMLGLVQQQTGISKIHFIGFNQGGMLPLAAIASAPAVAATLASAVLLAPLVFLANVTSPVINSWGTGVTPDSFFYQQGLLFGEYNYTNTQAVTDLLSRMGYDFTDYLGGGGDALVTNITGPNCCVGDQARSNLGASVDSNWVVSSYRNLIHYQQELRNGEFQYWDYMSREANAQHYGFATPPPYPLGNIPSSLPLFIISGGRDWLADPPNINRLVEVLRTPKTLNLPTYAHLDLLFSNTIVDDVYHPVVQWLQGEYLEYPHRQ